MRHAECHPDRRYWARGMCRSCYEKAMWAANPGRRDDKVAFTKAWRRANPDKSREYSRRWTIKRALKRAAVAAMVAAATSAQARWIEAFEWPNTYTAPSALHTVVQNGRTIYQMPISMFKDGSMAAGMLLVPAAACERDGVMGRLVIYRHNDSDVIETELNPAAGKKLIDFAARVACAAAKGKQPKSTNLM